MIWAFIGIFARVLFPFAGILTPRIVIDEIVAGVSQQRFITVMAVMGLVLIVINYLNGYVRSIVEQHTRRISAADFTIKHSHKLLTMDFANREQPDFIKLNNKTTQKVYNNDGADFFIVRLSDVCVNIGGLLLFGGVIAMVHPLIIVLLGLSVVINGLLQRWHRKYDEARREYVGQENKKKWTARWAISHKAHAQDVRVYSMLDWLTERFDFHLLNVRKSDTTSAKMGRTVGIVDSLMFLIRDGAAYAFLTYLLLNDRIGLGEFVMLFVAIGGMAAWINGILTSGTDLFRCSVSVSDRRETLAYPDLVSNTSKSLDDLMGSGLAPEIRLTNVSYVYPEAKKATPSLSEGSVAGLCPAKRQGFGGRAPIGDGNCENNFLAGEKEPTINNISLTIKKGERLAIVGVNGAGKTTLIKLICGFYKPTIGDIFYNDTNIREYDKDDYFSVITAVFQSIYLLADTIAVNVAQSHQPDTEKVRNCLIKAGLWEKVKSLEKGIETNLVREVHEDAIDLSGGEQQKLALARALYKDASLIILDEPTAALDPIAESEMYQQYAGLTKGKTSIYISHRLASTRFCDRIILLDGNIIAEEGTHEQLMAEGGKYAEMFATQASYYQNNQNNKIQIESKIERSESNE